MLQEPFADEGYGKLNSKKKADSLGNAKPETGVADQPKLAPPVRNIGSRKSDRVSKPKRQDPKSDSEATKGSSSFKSSAAKSSGPAKQATASNDGASIGTQPEGSRNEQIEEQPGSEVSASESSCLGGEVSDELTLFSEGFNDQAFDTFADRLARRDEEETGETLDDLIKNDDLAGIRSPAATVAAAEEDDQRVSAELGSNPSLGDSAGNSDVPEETPAMRERDGTRAEDNSKQRRRAAARILAMGILASACIFASEQFGATAWLAEGVQKIRSQFSRPALSPKIQPIDGRGSAIEFVGDGTARAAEFGFGSGGDQETIGDLDGALRIAEDIESAPSADRSTGNADRSTAFSSGADGEAASAPSADRSVPERTYASSSEPSTNDSTSNALSEMGMPDGTSETTTTETESELVLAGNANAEDVRAFSLDAADAERKINAAFPFRTASASGSSVAQSPLEQALSDAADYSEEGLGGPQKVEVLNDSCDCSLSEKPKDLAQQSSLSGGNRSRPDENAATLFSDEIASFDPMPDAPGEAASMAACGSIFGDKDSPSFADLNSLQSELELEFEGIHSRFDLLAARLELLFAGLEPGSAFHGGAKAAGNPLLESHDDANAAGGVDCRPPPNHSGQNRETASRAGKGSQPYLIATALDAADGEFSMPELGYGVVLDVLEDGAGGWLVVMENATLRLD